MIGPKNGSAMGWKSRSAADDSSVKPTYCFRLSKKVRPMGVALSTQDACPRGAAQRSALNLARDRSGAKRSFEAARAWAVRKNCANTRVKAPDWCLAWPLHWEPD